MIQTLSKEIVCKYAVSQGLVQLWSWCTRRRNFAFLKRRIISSRSMQKSTFQAWSFLRHVVKCVLKMSTVLKWVTFSVTEPHFFCSDWRTLLSAGWLVAAVLTRDSSSLDLLPFCSVTLRTVLWPWYAYLTPFTLYVLSTQFVGVTYY